MNSDEIKAAARIAYYAAAEEMDGWPYDSERDVFEDGFQRGFAAATPVGGQAEPSDAPEFTVREIGLMELGMSELRRQRGDVPWNPEHAAEMRALQLRLQSWQAAAAVPGEQA